MPRSLQGVIAVLVLLGVLELFSIVLGLTEGVFKVSSSLLSLVAAWGLSRRSRFWRIATLVWLGFTLLAGTVLLMIFLAGGLASMPRISALSDVSAMPWTASTAVTFALLLYGWMMHVLLSGPVRRWFAEVEAQTPVAVA